MSLLPNAAVRRLIGRELRRSKGRTAALFLLSFVPILFVLMVAVSGSNADSYDESWGYGQADAVITLEEPTDLAAVDLPGDPLILTWNVRSIQLGQAEVVMSDAPYGDPLLDGLRLGLGGSPGDARLIGRTPDEPFEAIVSTGLAELLVPSGSDDLLGTSFDWSEGALTIVGLIDRDVIDDREPMFVGLGGVREPDAFPDGRRTRFVGMFDWPGAAPELTPDQQLIENGHLGMRDQIATMNQSGVDEAGLISALMMMGISVATGAVAMAAWSSSARRRLHDVGILLASGGSPRHAAQVQAGQALTIASLAAAGAVGTALLVFPKISWLPGTENGRLDWPVGAMAVPIIIAVTAATLAGWWPASQSARAPLTAVLAGRLPRRPTSAMSAGTGVVSVVVGLVLLAGASAAQNNGDLIAGTLGLVAIAIGVMPILGWFFRHLARTAKVLPLVPRLIVRDAARHAGRTTASVLAIGAVIAGVWVGAVDAQEFREGPKLGDSVETSHWLMISDPSVERRDSTTDDLVEQLGETSIGAVSRLDAYSSGWPEGGSQVIYLNDGTLSGVDADGLDFRMVDAVPTDSFRDPSRDLVIIRVGSRVEQAELASISADPRARLATVIRDERGRSSFAIGDPGDPDDDERVVQLVLLSIGFVVSSIVVACMAMLAASEVRDDLTVMGSVGAAPGFRRRFLATQTLLYTAVATVAGLVIGTLIRLMVDAEGGLPIPLEILAGLLAMPLVVSAAVFLLASIRRTPATADLELAA